MFHAIIVRRSDNVIVAEACDKGIVTAGFAALNKATMLGYKVSDIYDVIEWVDEQEVVIDKVGDIYASTSRNEGNNT